MIESVSRRAFSSSSGTYNVRASELARERKLNIFNVVVQFLDDTQHTFQIEKKAKGSVLLDQVYQHIELIEKDYFGLQFTENGSPPCATNTEITRKTVYFWIRRFEEEGTLEAHHRQLYQRATTAEQDRAIVAAHLENPFLSTRTTSSTYNISMDTVRRRLKEVGELKHRRPAKKVEFTQRHKEERRWLDANKSVKKQVGTNAQFWLAVRFYPPEPSRLGEEFTRYLLCLQLRKLLLDGRMTAPKNTALLLASFTVQAELGDFDLAEHPPNYLSEFCLLPKQTAEDERRIKELHKLHKGQSPADAEANFLEHAKRLDCYGVESHPAKDYNGKDIFIGVTSIGIVVFQNNIRVNTFSWGKIVKISFKKKQFFIQLKREPSESYDTVLGFNMRSGRAAKALWRCSVERHGFFRLRAPRRRPFLGALSALAGIAAPAVPRTETQALEDARRERCGRSFVRRSSSRNRDRSSSAASPAAVSALSAVSRGGGGRVTGHGEPPPRPAWTDTDAATEVKEDDGGFLERALRVPFPYVDESESECETAQEEGVCIRLYAGADGRFGFNVRGGAGLPVLVSRVAPRTRQQLQEGDQVISINGQDVEELTHEQVVQIIRNTRGVLTLVVKPNAVYEAEESVSTEPAVCFVPLGAAQVGQDALEQSMLLLGDGLASGAAITQYETLLRRLPEESTAVSKLPQNLNKNRYRDIAPYDSTRVILKNGPSGDYINASYINMEIPNTDQVLTYIATQGPLPSTVGDFWQMVWESESSLIVMLTVLTERGRTKCHQYWPKVGNSALRATPDLTIYTNSEQNLGHYMRRELTIKSSCGAVRTVTQLQYTAWPDHGAPDDPAAFIQFTQLCSNLRNRKPDLPAVVEELTKPSEVERTLAPPMIVHCSAGVGRTGALALAETALALIAARQPLYPLDLVRVMRQQRPMCIQNAIQYKFVCESIQLAYTQGLVKPSSDTSSN